MNVFINVLMIAVAYQGIAFPVVWEVLGREGSSSAADGTALLRRFLQLAGPEKIRVVTADREFIGEEWLAFLAGREIPFAVRLRRRRRLALGSPQGPALPAGMFFRALPLGQRLLLPKRPLLPKRCSRSTVGVGRSRRSLQP